MKKILIKLFFIALLAAILALLWPVLQRNQEEPINKETPPENKSAVEQQPLLQIPTSNFSIDTIVATHTYMNGVHTLTGTVSLPTPCYEMSVDSTVVNGRPEQATINFVVTPPPGDIACIQVIDDREFETRFGAAPDSIISATVNGEPVMLVTDDKSGTLKPVQ